jgi:imidazolonepropionase-like amidohydrolase
MKVALLVLALSTLLGVSPAASPVAADGPSTVLIVRGARLIDGEGGPPIEGAVVVAQDGVIVKVFRDGEAPIPDGRIGALTIDARGWTILPGLIDGHVHLGGTSGARISAAELVGGRIDHDLAAYLFFGVTTIRSLGDAPRMAFGLKKLDAAADARAPNILAAGPMLTASGASPLALGIKTAASSSLVAAEISNEAEGRLKVRELIASGADTIKVMYEEGPPSRRVPVISEAIFRAIVAEAHSAGVPVCVHTSTCREVQGAVRAGADGVEHGVVREPIDKDTIRLLVENKTFYCPTICVIEAPLRIAGGFNPESDSLLSQTILPAVWASINNPASFSSQARANPEKMEARKRMLQQAVENLQQVYRAGVPICLGTDSGNEATFPGYSVHREMELLVQAGITPMRAIQAATMTAARYCRIDSRAGSIRVGKRADLLIVDGNPLESISALRRIKFVVIGGKVVDREHLFDDDH